MDVAQLATWRDAALILLAVQAVVLGLGLLAALYWSWRALGRVEGRLRPLLLRTRLGVWRADTLIQRAMRTLATPFVRLGSLATGLRRALEVLARR
ncbi:MAG: hypothetical protein FJ026_13880 [Chloroflexi bacterium]|nr:hypothetical protein [Chloroflexota bacterium]